MKSARYYNTQTLTINPANVRTYNGQKATGEVTIIYNGSTAVLDKPLIVFEGYDTWKILEPDNPKKNITWEDLLNGYDSFDRIGYFPSSFQSALASRGYDIVFVDYDNGTDYIQRNAYFAEAVINTINQQKTGNEPNVVMGISMGGLVGRYALADMESRSEDHDTRLYISMDSPHQGANVPLGLQVMIRHLTDVKVEVGIPALGITGKIWDIGSTYPEYSVLLNLLQQPATRQMLIEQLSGFGEGIYIDNSIHTAFIQEYEQLGYPRQCRNIAVSDGSGATSTSWQYTPGSDIFSLSADCDGPWWSGLLGPFVVAASPFVKQLWEMPVITIASILPGNYGVRANFNIKALPNTGTTKVYDGEIKIVKKILWLISVSSTLTSKEINYTGTSLPWTSAQGGFMSFNTYTGGIPDLPSCVDMPPVTGNFCFVPTVSSLDIQGTQNLLKGYTAANDLQNSMFDNIYTEPSVNRIHTNFNTDNTQWIILELDKDTTLLQQSFIYKFNGCELLGPSVVCNTGGTFSISNIPYGVILSWNKSGNLSEDSSGDDYIVLKATSSGSGWVQAQLSGGGVNVFSDQKTVWVGNPSFTWDYVNSDTELSPFEYGFAYPVYAIDEVAMGLIFASTDWSYTGPLTSIAGNLQLGKYRAGRNLGAGYIRYEVANTCGSTWHELYYEVVDNWFLSVSPNPATNEATLTIESVRSEVIDISIEWDLEIYDQMQILRTKKVKLKGDKYKINTSGWQGGMYFVRVKFKDEILTGKFLVNR